MIRVLCRRPIGEQLRLGFLLAGTAVLYLWNLSVNGWANSFYSAAAQAGASDWTAMLFGASDSGKLFLSGYSQGGHAALATQRLIEARTTAEFPVAGSAPMSGPYALEKTVQESVDDPPVTGSALASFIIIGQQRVYGNIFRKTSDAFRQPYADFIANYMPGRFELDDLLRYGIVPQDQSALLAKPYRESFRDNANHPLRVALRANTLLGWTPRTPTLLCGGRYDAVVPFFNTVDAFQDFASRGAPVSIVDVSDPAMQALMVPQPFTVQEKMDYHAKSVALVCMALVRQTFYAPSAP